MASLAFQPYVDKENAGAFGVRPNKGQTAGGLGKIFGKGSDQSLVTPRKALGVVNRDLKAVNNGSSLKPIHQQNKGLQMKSSNIQPLSSRSGNIMQKPSLNENPKKKVVSVNKIPIKVDPMPPKPQEEDVEHMYIPKDDGDDYEDIWPKKDRISTYFHKLAKWRPPCLFGHLPDSDEEDPMERQRRIEEEDRRMEESLAKYPQEKDEEIKAEDLLVPEDFDDIPLASISLDISVDILESIGTLELKD